SHLHKNCASAKKSLPFRHPLLKLSGVGLRIGPFFLGRRLIARYARLCEALPGDRDMADEERKSRRLQVATMRPEDSGRGIARLPRAMMTELGLAEGDVIELSGKRTTPARAVGPYPEDEGLEIIRLD